MPRRSKHDIDADMSSAEKTGKLQPPMTPVNIDALRHMNRLRIRDRFMEDGNYRAPTLSGEILHIMHECDPIQFLSDIVNGIPLPHYVVKEDGAVETYYNTPSMRDRVRVAMFLANKYLPNVQVVKHDHALSPTQEGERTATPGGFATILAKAARANERAQLQRRSEDITPLNDAMTGASPVTSAAEKHWGDDPPYVEAQSEDETNELILKDLAEKLSRSFVAEDL